MLHLAEMRQKRIFITADLKLWVCQNVSMEDLLTGPKTQAKVLSHFGDLVLGEGHLHSLTLIVMG